MEGTAMTMVGTALKAQINVIGVRITEGNSPIEPQVPQASRFQNDDFEDDRQDGDESWFPNDYRGSHRQLPQKQLRPRQKGNPRNQNQRRF